MVEEILRKKGEHTKKGVAKYVDVGAINDRKERRDEKPKISRKIRIEKWWSLTLILKIC